jgi:hypothetical protein
MAMLLIGSGGRYYFTRCPTGKGEENPVQGKCDD